MHWQAHPAQRRWLRREKRDTNVLLTGRRFGKTEVLAVELLHDALFIPQSQQAIVSVTIDQARLGYDMMLQFCYQSGLAALFDGPPKETPFPTVKFKTGSSVTARSTSREGMYLRGHKFHRVKVDEADYVSERVIQEVLRMTLADVGGQIDLYTTPAAKRQYVYQQMVQAQLGDSQIVYQSGSSYDNPHIDHDYIKRQEAKMTDSQQKREVLGLYANDDTAVFRWGDIMAAYEACDWDGDPQEPQHSPPNEHRYVAGWDLAKSADWTVGIVLDVTKPPYKQVAFYRWQRENWQVTANRISEVSRKYKCLPTIYDATGVGDVVGDMIIEPNWQPFVFTAKSKADLLQNVQLLLEKHHLVFPFIRQLVDELQAYEWDDKRLVQDCVMALGLACWGVAPVGGVQYLPSLYS